MKNVVLIGLSVLFLSINAFAQSEQTFNSHGLPTEKYSSIGPLDQLKVEGASYFEKLGVMFENGSKPDPQKLANKLWKGRCFFKEGYSDLPRSSALIFLNSNNYLVTGVFNYDSSNKITEGYGGAVGIAPVNEDSDRVDAWRFLTVADPNSFSAPLQQIIEENSYLGYRAQNGETTKMREGNNFVLVELDGGQPPRAAARCYFFTYLVDEDE